MIRQKLKAKLTQSLKARDMERVGVIRMLISAINNKEIAFRSQDMEMKDKHIIKVIKKEIGQRKESIESYKEGDRDDLVEKETSEMEILKELLEEFSPEDDKESQNEKQ